MTIALVSHLIDIWYCEGRHYEDHAAIRHLADAKGDDLLGVSWPVYTSFYDSRWIVDRPVRNVCAAN